MDKESNEQESQTKVYKLLNSKIKLKKYTTGDESTARYTELWKSWLEPGTTLHKFEGRAKNHGSRSSISNWCWNQVNKSSRLTTNTLYVEEIKVNSINVTFYFYVYN